MVVAHARHLGFSGYSDYLGHSEHGSTSATSSPSVAHRRYIDGHYIARLTGYDHYSPASDGYSAVIEAGVEVIDYGSSSQTNLRNFMMQIVCS